jgi:hypothetical protein
MSKKMTMKINIWNMFCLSHEACYQMMRTSWSRGHTTHNQDWNLILKSRNRSDRVWHNRNLLQGITLLEWSRMMPQSQLIFDKSDSVRSRTEECKIHSHTLKLKNSEVIFINGSWNFGYMSLNSSRKINLNESTFVG